MGFFNKLFSKEKKEKLDSGLQKTKEGVWNKITRAIAGKSKIDDDVLDELEDSFITSDVGVDTTLKLIDRIRERVAKDKYLNTDEFNRFLYEEIAAIMTTGPNEEVEDFKLKTTDLPYVILVVGVNGVGKTTTIGKLANQYKNAGYNVVLGAGDTYRAAAIDQLEIWGNRVGVPVIKHQQKSAPSAVAFDTVSYAKAHGAEVVIIDTAGRMHNKIDLMNELSKIKNSIKKVLPNAPQEVLLVLDGSTGQNAYEQAKQFSAATDVNALAVTKLDGTAKGGVVIGISDQLKIPVKYIGIGEGIDDLQIFHPQEFAKSLFLKEKDA